jgi:hypothetical protein
MECQKPSVPITEHFAKKLFTKPESAKKHDNFEGYLHLWEISKEGFK